MTDALATVDVHQHFLPESLVRLLRRRSRPPRIEGSDLILCDGGFPFDPSGHEIEARVATLDRYGIDVAIVSLQPTLGLAALERSEREELVGTWEDGVSELVRGSDGRCLALAGGPRGVPPLL